MRALCAPGSYGVVLPWAQADRPVWHRFASACAILNGMLSGRGMVLLWGGWQPLWGFVGTRYAVRFVYAQQGGEVMEGQREGGVWADLRSGLRQEGLVVLPLSAGHPELDARQEGLQEHSPEGVDRVEGDELAAETDGVQLEEGQVEEGDVGVEGCEDEPLQDQRRVEALGRGRGHR